MTWVLVAICGFVIWAVGYAAGAREATRRAEVERLKEQASRNATVCDFGQKLIPRVTEDGSVYWEVVRDED